MSDLSLIKTTSRHESDIFSFKDVPGETKLLNILTYDEKQECEYACFNNVSFKFKDPPKKLTKIPLLGTLEYPA